MSKYQEILEEVIEFPRGCFFAVTPQEFANAINAQNLKVDEIKSFGACLYGTDNSITEYFELLSKKRKRIAKECTAQEIYDHEFDFYERNGDGGDGYADMSAMEAVLTYFDVFDTFSIKRR